MKQSKQFIISIVSMLAIMTSVGVMAVPASAKSGVGMPKPQMAKQCVDHPGFAHYGFSSLQDCLTYVAQHTKQHGHGYGGNGNGHDKNISIGTIFSNLGNISGGALTITVNFITNIFK